MGNTADAGSDNIMFRCAMSANKDELWHQLLINRNQISNKKKSLLVNIIVHRVLNFSP